MFKRQRGPALRFRLFGTPVRIGLGFPVTIVAVPLLFLGSRGHDPWFLGGWLLLVTVSVLVHEAGHVAALRTYGFHPEVSLNAFGGLTSTDDDGRLSPLRSVIVSVSGPAAGILLGLTIESALVPIGGRGVLWVRSASWMVNIWWSLVNLLPIMPLDGGHVVREAVQVASRRRGAAVAWLVVGVVASIVGALAVFGTRNGHWITLVAVLAIATNVRFFAFTARQRRLQDITIAHEQLVDGDLETGIATLLPITESTESALVSDEAYTTLAWALLHEGRYVELCRLNPDRFNSNHRPLLSGATAWYQGDLMSAFHLVSGALATGRVDPPNTYFARVFGRLGERERLAHHIAGLPPDASGPAWRRLHHGLAAAGVAA